MLGSASAWTHGSVGTVFVPLRCGLCALRAGNDESRQQRLASKIDGRFRNEKSDTFR